MHFLVLNMEHWDGHARRLACTLGSIMDMEYKASWCQDLWSMCYSGYRTGFIGRYIFSENLKHLSVLQCGNLGSVFRTE